jgi:GPH family glycoside/pentoside/hexuronide:cation symporter/oligogalacturonide transporter
MGIGRGWIVYGSFAGRNHMDQSVTIQSSMKRHEPVLFAWGDVFGGGAQALISVIYLVFLTDIIGIPPAIAGAAILISKVWDAVTDPIMGVISDNTRTRFGRRRPYILGGGMVLVGAFALMWFPTAGWSSVAKAVYAIVTYVLYSTVATIISVPYSSLSAEITTDIRERNKVNVLRLVVSTLATAICTLIPSYVLEVFNAGAITLHQFYLIIGLAFGVFFGLPLVLIGIFTRERVKMPDTRSAFSFKVFVSPLGTKTFRGLVYIYLCQAIAMDILGAGIIYYSRYVARGSSTVFLGIFIGVQLLMFPVINVLVNKVDKKRIYYFGLPLSILSFALVGLYPSAWNVGGAYFLVGLTALGFAGAQLMSWIIFPDTIDVSELKTGERMTGSHSGIMTFIRKTSSAVAIQIFSLMLAVSGYIKPPDPAVFQPQPASAILGIRIAMSASFVILMTLGWLLGKNFPLSNKDSVAVRRLLKRREDPLFEHWSTDEAVEYTDLAGRLF